MLPNIHILGIQGSGKGTQSALLVNRYGFSYVSSGDLFRERATWSDDFARQLSQELSRGRLLADKLLFQTVKDYLCKTEITTGFLGDGVIRSIHQYQGLMDIWELFSLDQPLLIHLTLSEDIALQRIKHRQEELSNPDKYEHHLKYSGKLLKRNDDNPLAIQERFSQFHRMTEPVIKIFEEQGRCIRVDANQEIEAIHADITQKLEAFLPDLEALHAPY